MNKKKPIIIILAIVGILLLGFFLRSYLHRNDGITASGTIEAEEIDISSQVSGKIEKIFVDEGSNISKGQLLVSLDDMLLKDQKRQAYAKVKAARAQLNMMQRGARPEERQIAQAKKDQAAADLEQKQKDYNRYSGLYKKGVISRQHFDQATTLYRVAKDSFSAALNNYNMVISGPRSEDIETARAQLEQAEAMGSFASTQLSYARILSPVTGTVLVKSVQAGEVVTAGSTLLTVADLSTVELKIYLAEKDIGKVQLQQEFPIYVDAYPDQTFQGSVVFIADKSEFTPKNIQTKEERINQVFAVKLQILNADLRLKPGMPADVKISQ